MRSFFLLVADCVTHRRTAAECRLFCPSPAPFGSFSEGAVQTRRRRLVGEESGHAAERNSRPIRSAPTAGRQSVLSLPRLFRRAIGELVGSFDCLVTFQWMPQGWRDHRRPLDSHLQVWFLLFHFDNSTFVAFGEVSACEAFHCRFFRCLSATPSREGSVWRQPLRGLWLVREVRKHAGCRRQRCDGAGCVRLVVRKRAF